MRLGYLTRAIAGLLWLLEWPVHAHRRWYQGELQRQRHWCEEECRRLNGTAVWNDEQ